ncbi:MAG TPA: hypothetical protein VLL04_05235, partial [Rhizomicrobium sp.]|nr:hypothetical protein [Rhizomicrobium sp.]
AASVSRDGDTVTLDMKTPDNGVTLMVPAEAKLRRAQVGPVTIPAFGRRIALVCVTPDCGTTRIILQLGSPKPVSLELLSFPPGMPPDAAKLLKARPPEAVPSQEGDLSVLAAKIAVPGR